MRSRIRLTILRAKEQQRGFFHVMLLVIIVLGLSVWGISELLQRTVQQKNAVEQRSDTNLAKLKYSLLSYALLPPLRVHSDSFAGAYNIYHSEPAALSGGSFFRVPFRRFSLPCPDHVADFYMDGVADTGSLPCYGDKFSGEVFDFKRLGRLPWREFADADGGGSAFGLYVRGVDGRDLRDGYNQRFWYLLSENVANVPTPINPHALLRLTSGWLSVADTDGNVLSDRVAAAIVSPGLPNSAVPPEITLYREGGTPSSVAATLVSVIHERYLDDTTYGNIVYVSVKLAVTNVSPGPVTTIDPPVTTTVRNSSPRLVASTGKKSPSTDQLEYLTIDELAAFGEKGVSLLETSDFWQRVGNVTAVLDAHLHRFGFLPDPALFEDASAEARARAAGIGAGRASSVSLYAIDVTATVSTMTVTTFPPALPVGGVTTTATTTLTSMVSAYDATLANNPIVRLAKINASASVDVVVPLHELPPVYFARAVGSGGQSGSLVVFTDNFSDSAVISPPYNVPLADLQTALNDQPLPAAVTKLLVRDEHYPTVGLFGINNKLVSVDSSAATTQLAVLNQSVPLSLSGGAEIVVALADDAYGYFQQSVLTDVISYANGDTVGIDSLPPYAAKVLLPAGTFLTLDTDDLIVRLPAGYVGNYDRATGAWSLNSSENRAIVVLSESNPNLLATVSAVPNGADVIVGDIGFLPLENAGASIALSGTGGGVLLNDGYFYKSSVRLYSSVPIMDDKNPVSYLTAPMRLYSANTLEVIPLPPPGRPVVGGDALQRLPTPMQIVGNSEFILPAHTRVVYPVARIYLGIGDDFTFPDDSVAHIPAGAAMTVVLEQDAVSAGGKILGNTTPVTIRETFHHGAVLRLNGAKPVFGDDGEFLSSQQAVFDIHFRHDVIADVSVVSPAPARAVSVTMGENSILQPFTGRWFKTSFPAVSFSDLLLLSETRVRAGFLTHPRFLPLHDVDEVYVNSVNAGIILTAFRGLVAPDTVVSLSSITLTLNADEDTQFLLPAFGSARHLRTFTTTLTAAALTATVTNYILPPDTAVFDHDWVATLATLTTASGAKPFALLLGEPLSLTLAQVVKKVTTGIRLVPVPGTGATTPQRVMGTVTRGIVKNRLALFPASDIYALSVATAAGEKSQKFRIPGGSMIDLLDGVAYPPKVVQNVARIPDKLQMVSEKATYIYLPQAVTLLADMPAVSVTSLIGGTPGLGKRTAANRISIRFISYQRVPGAVSSDAADLILRDSIQLPKNSYIVVPGGNPLNFLSDNVASVGASAKDSDFARLPDNSAAVVLSGATAIVEAMSVEVTTITAISSPTPPTPPVTTYTYQTQTLDVTASIAGPAYIGLANATEAAAFINHSDYMSGQPVVFLNDRGHIADELSPSYPLRRHVYSKDVYGSIPAAALLDIRGNMALRSDSGIFSDLLPLDTAQLLADFPMVYAVAPQCRKQSSVGSHCAEDTNQGLNFALESGEEYVLREALDAPAGAFLTAALPEAKLRVVRFSLGMTKSWQTLTVDGVHVEEKSGLVSFFGSNVLVSVGERLVVSPASSAPLRVYLGVPDLQAVSDLTGKHYALLSEALTLHSGGYVGDNYDSAGMRLSIKASATVTLGVGAKLKGGLLGEKIFGVGASGEVVYGNASMTVDLSDYIPFPNSSYNLSLTLAADSADVDTFGALYERAVAGKVVTAMALDFKIRQTVTEVNSFISVTAGSYIEMDPGYLWQGYIPPSSATLDFSPNANLASSFPSSVYLRIHPTLSHMNFFGSGIETAEGLDGLSFAGGSLTLADGVTLIGKPSGAMEQGLLDGLSGGTTSLAIDVVFHNLTTGARTVQTGYWRPTTQLTLSGKKFSFAGGAAFNLYGSDGTSGRPPARHPFSDPATFPVRSISQYSNLLDGAWISPAQSNYIEGLTINGTAVSVLFYPPYYQINPTPDAPAYFAWDLPFYGTRANLVSVTAGLVARLDTSKKNFFLVSDAELSTRQPPTIPVPGVDAQPANYTLTTTRPVAAAIGTGGKTVTTHGDLFFYMDRAYNHLNADLRQTLTFGSKFKISGPGAIVPPFGGSNEQAVKEVYAERSNLMRSVLNYPALHPLYDKITAKCVDTTKNDCEEMYETSDWFPIVGGVLAFEGVDVSLHNAVSQNTSLDEELRLIMPQPRALIRSPAGDVIATIYAGSIIYPRRGIIYPANRLPASDYVLSVSGGAVAAVDVSPVISPRPLRYHREKGVNNIIDSGEFNYAPVSVNASVVMEPLGFQTTNIYETQTVILVDHNTQSSFVNTIGVTLSYLNDIDKVERYDGTFSRGFLLDDRGATLIANYYAGDLSLYTSTNGYSPMVNHSGGAVFSGTPFRNFNMDFGNPLAYRWNSLVSPASHFLPAGAAVKPDGNRLQTSSSSPSYLRAVGLNYSSTNSEFTALRLAHRINIPENAAVPFSVVAGDYPPYPSSLDKMFQFPANSRVMMLQNDLNSWVSAHPYLSRYAVGLKVIGERGTTDATGKATTVNATVSVSAANDGYREWDIGGSRLLHYHRAESLPKDPLFSAAQVYTNVWLRLTEGGSLTDRDGNVIALSPNSLLNPVMGTYLPYPGPDNAGRALQTELLNNYLTEATALNTVEVLRPAFTLPAGATLVVGANGGNIRNVKAALIFSLTPLQSVGCPSGDLKVASGQGGVVASGQDGVLVTLNQVREGVGDSRYPAATGQSIGLGHPCMWLDDSENLDGDRFYVYRGRRRYGNEQAQIFAHALSNDRTFLLGGKLELRL